MSPDADDTDAAGGQSGGVPRWRANRMTPPWIPIPKEAVPHKLAVYGDAAYGTGPSSRPPGTGARIKTNCSRHRRLVGSSPRTASISTWPTAPSPARPCDRGDPPGQGRRRGRPFGTACATCPLAAQCTNSPAGRTVTIGADEAPLARARAAQADPAWRADYTATRPKVERKLGAPDAPPPRRPPSPGSRHHQGRRRLRSPCRRGQPGPSRRARTAPTPGKGWQVAPG